MVADMVADMVTNMEVDMVADMVVDFILNASMAFSIESYPISSNSLPFLRFVSPVIKL